MHNERELRELLDKIHEHDVPKPSGNYEGMVEFERRRSTKEQLLNQVIATSLDHALAIGALRGLCADPADLAKGEGWHVLAVQLERALMAQDAAEARLLLPEFIDRFRQEPLLYTPLSQDGHPKLILRANLAQMMLRGLVHNLPKQGMIRETYQLLRLARSMEASQTLSGPRTTEYDRLFQLGLQAVVEAVAVARLEGARRGRKISRCPGDDRRAVRHDLARSQRNLARGHAGVDRSRSRMGQADRLHQTLWP